MSLMNTPCTIVRRSDSGEIDDYGNAVDSESTFDTVCDLQQRQRDEPETGGEFSVTVWDLFLPVDTPIDTSDVVIVGDAEYEVTGDPWNANQGSAAVNHTAATLRKTGNIEGS